MKAVRFPKFFLALVPFLTLVACASSGTIDPDLIGAWGQTNQRQPFVIIFKSNGRFTMVQIHNGVLTQESPGVWRREGSGVNFQFFDEEGNKGIVRPVQTTRTDSKLMIGDESDYVPAGEYKRIPWRESESIDVIPKRYEWAITPKDPLDH